MSKVFILSILLIFTVTVHGQKILSSTISECRSQFEIDPDVVKITNTSSSNALFLFVAFKNGDNYKFTFDLNNYKLVSMTLKCINQEKTIERYNQEISRRNATKQSDGGYTYADERNRIFYLWLTQDDLGKTIINWEAKWPFRFD